MKLMRTTIVVVVEQMQYYYYLKKTYKQTIQKVTNSIQSGEF